MLSRSTQHFAGAACGHEGSDRAGKKTYFRNACGRANATRGQMSQMENAMGLVYQEGNRQLSKNTAEVKHIGSGQERKTKRFWQG